jgi:hypothetical protein
MDSNPFLGITLDHDDFARTSLSKDDLHFLEIPRCASKDNNSYSRRSPQPHWHNLAKKRWFGLVRDLANCDDKRRSMHEITVPLSPMGIEEHIFYQPDCSFLNVPFRKPVLEKSYP